MRIAYIVSSLAPLGPVIVVRNLVEGMTARGHECMVFYFDEREERMEFACPTKRISFWGREDFSQLTSYIRIASARWHMGFCTIGGIW